MTCDRGGVAFERLVDADVEVVARDVPGRPKRRETFDERAEVKRSSLVRMDHTAARVEGGARIGKAAAEEQPALVETAIVLRQIVQRGRRIGSRHHVAVAQRDEPGRASRAGRAEY